ncbi:hypothetical protein E6O75_ATG01266 [Venturia nashicola]|uniref:Siderophore biosynthesis n=1 Tax=Venturia nashicola TaxID=86259 RepID=A0A4Z1PE09_9PEZI|nr:hypothetical protein E6O75_ATG01266 [Venturia nashicola]
MPSTTSILTLLALALTAHARTNLSGCTSSKTIAYGGASILWYVPGTGEICEALDCGGGRAPPKTTVPGCAAYSGTGTYSPSYIAIATDSAKSGYATSIGSWTSSLSSVTSKVVVSGASASASASGYLSSVSSAIVVVPSTTAKATLSSAAAAAAATGTGTAAGTGGLIIDSSAVGNGTVLSTSSRTPTAASASGSSASSSATGAAGVVRLGRDAMVVIGGAVVGVALL